ncbi:MAG: transglutaminase domain-containing protein [Blastocatellia bacterium]
MLTKQHLRPVAVVGASLLIAVLGLVLGLRSASLKRTLRRASAKAKIRLAAIEGENPRPLSLEGRLVALEQGSRVIRGARVEAMESTSGYGAMTDNEGHFFLPHLTWYPGASYTLIVLSGSGEARQFKVRGSASFPLSGTQDIGALALDRGENLLQAPPGEMSYDSENDDYYRNLFADLTAGVEGDESKITAVCRFVAGRLNYHEMRWSFPNPAEIIRKGSGYCSQLALAMAALTTAGHYPTRTVHLSDTPDYKATHVVVEVYYGDGWHLFDPTYGVEFRDSRGEVASYREIRLDPGLIVNTAFDRTKKSDVDAIMKWMPAAYESGLHQIYLETRGDYCPKR